MSTIIEVMCYSIIFGCGFKIAHEDGSPIGEPFAIITLWMGGSIAAALMMSFDRGYMRDEYMRNALAFMGMMAFFYGKWRQQPTSVRLV